jgi:hypothetical protein
MTPPKTWAAGAVLTGLLAAGMPSAAVAGDTPPSPGADAIAQSADAISRCLTANGYPPLPTSPVLTPAAGAAPGALPAITLPAAATPTTPTATPGVLAVPAAATTTALPGVPGVALPAALQCGQVVINNNLYLVTVTTTTTTTNVDAPITAAAGSISTTSNPATPAAPPATSAIGRPLHVRGSTSARHRRPARARPAVRVRLSGRTAYAKRVVRFRLVRQGDAGHR